MEQLAQRKIRSVNESREDWDEEYDEDEQFSDEYDDDDDGIDDSLTEQQRMEEGRRMFQIFAAKMFEQRVLTAYREKVFFLIIHRLLLIELKNLFKN
jgi:hypothetical protein